MISITFNIVNIYNLKYITYFIQNDTNNTVTIFPISPDKNKSITFKPNSYTNGFITIPHNMSPSTAHDNILINLSNLNNILKQQNIKLVYYINDFSK